MSQLLGEGQGRLTPPERLRWIAQTPQCPGRMSQAHHPRLRQGPLHYWVGEGAPLLEVRPSRSVFAQEGQGDPEMDVGFQEVHWHDLMLRQP